MACHVVSHTASSGADRSAPAEWAVFFLLPQTNNFRLLYLVLCPGKLGPAITWLARRAGLDAPPAQRSKPPPLLTDRHYGVRTCLTPCCWGHESQCRQWLRQRARSREGKYPWKIETLPRGHDFLINLSPSNFPGLMLGSLLCLSTHQPQPLRQHLLPPSASFSAAPPSPLRIDFKETTLYVLLHSSQHEVHRLDPHYPRRPGQGAYQHLTPSTFTEWHC